MSTCNDKQVILHQIFEGEYHLVVCGDRKNEGGYYKKKKKVVYIAAMFTPYYNDCLY